MDKNIKNCKEILELLIQRTENVNFVQHNEVHACTISFYKKMLSSARAVLTLNEDYYNACILISHMLEGIILLAWILDKPKERIRQYVDYGIVEYLAGLRVYPEKTDDVLKFIKEKDVQRFLKKEIKTRKITDEVLLEHKNYYSMWYKLEANSITSIADKLTINGRHPEIASIKHAYNIFCAYKHYSPYVILPRYGTNIIIENADEFLAISTALQCLYIAFLYLNQFQPQKINIEDITKRYTKVPGINWIILDI